MNQARHARAFALVVGLAGCASPLTVAEPRDDAAVTTPTFDDAEAPDSGEAGDAAPINDPPEDAGAG